MRLLQISNIPLVVDSPSIFFKNVFEKISESMKTKSSSKLYIVLSIEENNFEKISLIDFRIKSVKLIEFSIEYLL